MSMDQPPLVMGMTPSEYQAAFAYLDHANFAREVDEYEAQQQRYKEQPATGSKVHWIKRAEFWALFLGIVTLVHGLFVQWVWPALLKELPKDSPYAPSH
ncbi:hypothetical protein F4678DRAFT_458331 [Xylaria arbuscula]|nr:hypothetical protein F4678DRAFT_458331 [Xylaria arbuscula]